MVVGTQSVDREIYEVDRFEILFKVGWEMSVLAQLSV